MKFGMYMYYNHVFIGELQTRLMVVLTVYISFDIFMLQALAGSCAGHDCTEGNICKGKTSDGRFECIFKCKYFIFYILRFYLFKYVQPH
jgi:hypothetical protein